MSEATQALAVNSSTPLELETLRSILVERLHEFETRIGTEILQLEDESLEVSESLDKISTIDAIEYQELGERVKIAVEFADRATGFFEPWRLLFHKPYQAVLDRRKSVLSVVETSTKQAKDRLLQFEREERQRQETAARIATEQQNRDDEARRLELASQAEQAGMSDQAVDAILDAPNTLPSILPQAFERPSGLSPRKNWQAEVFDLGALVMAAAEGLARGDKRLLAFLEADQPALNREAKTHESSLTIPGVRAVNKGSLAVRR